MRAKHSAMMMAKCSTDLSAVRHKSVDNLSTSIKQSHDVRWSLRRLRRRAIIICVIKLLPLHLYVTKATESMWDNERMQIIDNAYKMKWWIFSRWQRYCRLQQLQSHTKNNAIRMNKYTKGGQKWKQLHFAEFY